MALFELGQAAERETCLHFPIFQHLGSQLTTYWGRLVPKPLSILFNKYNAFAKGVAASLFPPMSTYANDGPRTFMTFLKGKFHMQGLSG